MNSKTTAYNYGSSLGLKYRLFNHFRAIGNVTYSMLHHQSSNDGIEDGFNTPRWITNFSFGNDQVFQNLGFMVTWHWQSSYYWQSFLVNGNVPSFKTVDAQVSYQWNKVRLKIGGTNILNQYYHSFLGGPKIGVLVYSSILVSLTSLNH